MSKYSEATQRVFECSLQLLAGKLKAEQLGELRALVAAGELDAVDRLEEILGPKKAPNAD